MQKQDEDHGSFTTKYFGTLNPLPIKLPSNEYKGGKYVDIEVGAFFWNVTNATALYGYQNQLPLVIVRIPGISSGNYDINGNSTNVVTMICPEKYTKVTNGTTESVTYHFTYSPGRPDLYIMPPTPQITIEFVDANGVLINFTGNPYYSSFNIGY